MKRLAVVVVVVALGTAACSTPASQSGTTEPQNTATTGASPPGSIEPGSSSSTVAPDAPSVKPDGPLAPDFTLALASGGTFTLSDAAKPVYMVFWAEW
jgi:hypothetical protein